MHTLITGGGSGIGRATALRLAKRSRITIADKSGANAQAVANEIRASGGKADAYEVDVLDGEAVRTVVAKADAVEPIDALFNNAGISVRTEIADISGAEWDLMLDTHARGMFFVAQAVLRNMVPRKKGAIVQTSSDFAVMGVPGMAAYCAAKCAIYSLTKALSLEFVQDGIRVNAIGPGPIDTPILASNRTEAEYRDAVARNETRVPMGRLGKPDEVAAVVDFLLSERASYINGQLIHPNGGTVMW
jgi:NAD(P)-dependent dehydrogenase (short-subunit alcohol dehydrogenase family)